MTAVIVRNGHLETSDGLVLAIPEVTVGTFLGRGAHADVFRGVDSIGRAVVIKIWRNRASDEALMRAREEIKKLASLQDHGRLFAHVYLFGSVPVPKSPDRIAYAVMEYVDGVTGKTWKKCGRPLSDRYAIWKLIRTSLSTIHGEGLLHGDAHLGNVIIFPDTHGRYRQFVPPGLGIHAIDARYKLGPWLALPALGVKLIDCGSSCLWAEHEEFADRERRIIRENFRKLFPELRGQWLDKRVAGTTPGQTLDACDVWLEYWLKVERYLADPDSDPRIGGEREYSDMCPLERQIHGMLFESPFLASSVLREHMERLRFDYSRVLGEAFESKQNECLAGSVVAAPGARRQTPRRTGE